MRQPIVHLSRAAIFLVAAAESLATAPAARAAPMMVVHVSRIDRPAAEVFAVVGDFGGMDRWSPGVKVRMEGGLGPGLRRVQTAPDGRVNDELLLEYSLEQRLISYRLLNVDAWPRPYTTYEVKVKVAPIDATSSRVEWVMQAEPKPGAAGAPTADLLSLIHRSIMTDAARALGAHIQFEP